MRLPSFPLLYRLTIFAATALSLIFGGCGSNPKKAAPATSAPRPPMIVGEVTIVDKVRRFVLIDLQSNLYVPAPGTALRTTNAAGETAHLKASPEQKRPFVAADIVDGDPAVGDQVIR
ncbi:MAG: hypothetical protein ACREIF_07045 [Chthoniobacterales bacterium]